LAYLAETVRTPACRHLDAASRGDYCSERLQVGTAMSK